MASPYVSAFCAGPPSWRHSDISVCPHTGLLKQRAILPSKLPEKNETQFFSCLVFRLSHFQITFQSLSTKPQLVNGNLQHLVKWGYNDRPLSLFASLNKQVFSEGGLRLGNHSPQKRVLWEQAVLPGRMNTFQNAFCLLSFLIIWSILKPAQGLLT